MGLITVTTSSLRMGQGERLLEAGETYSCGEVLADAVLWLVDHVTIRL